MPTRIANLILDYDGILGYKDKQIEASAHKLIFDFINSKPNKRKDFVLHINSLRGISFFRTEFLGRLSRRIKAGSLRVYFSGCAGSFTYDLNNNKVIFSTAGLQKEHIAFIIRSKAIKTILSLSGQNDSEVIYYQRLSESEIYKLLKLEKRLYWDGGFLGSSKIFKCAIDIPESATGKVNNFIKGLGRKGYPIKHNLTNRILEITTNKSDKGNVIRHLFDQGLYAPGRIVAIGDNPQDTDKELLAPFPKGYLNHKYYFEGLTNCAKGGEAKVDERILFTNLETILSSLIRDF